MASDPLIGSPVQLSLSDGTTGETLRVLKFAGDPVQLAVADIKDPATGATQVGQAGPSRSAWAMDLQHRQRQQQQ
jgi:hypothetical protein